jgi:hypothetical protein
MRKINPEKINPTAAVSTITVAYTSLVIGLKLDGYIAISWTLLLAPLWAPIAMVMGLMAALCVAWLVLWCICAAARKDGGQ